jgi:hypothetical protein
MFSTSISGSWLLEARGSGGAQRRIKRNPQMAECIVALRQKTAGAGSSTLA